RAWRRTVAVREPVQHRHGASRVHSIDGAHTEWPPECRCPVKEAVACLKKSGVGTGAVGVVEGMQCRHRARRIHPNDSARTSWPTAGRRAVEERVVRLNKRGGGVRAVGGG